MLPHTRFHLFVWPRATCDRAFLGIEYNTGIIPGPQWMGFPCPGNDCCIDLCDTQAGAPLWGGFQSALHRIPRRGKIRVSQAYVYLIETNNSHRPQTRQADVSSGTSSADLSHHAISVHRIILERFWEGKLAILKSPSLG